MIKGSLILSTQEFQVCLLCEKGKTETVREQHDRENTDYLIFKIFKQWLPQIKMGFMMKYL